jgi:hypothetical protein
MQLDTRIPLAAVSRQPIRFAPESPIESLTAVAPAINALRGVQQQQQQQENQARQDAAFEAFRRGAQEIMGNPNATVSDLGRVVINNATTPAQLEAGRKMIEAELAYRQRKERLSGFFDQPMTANALLRMYAEEPEAAKLLESQVLTPSQRTVPVGPNIFERQQDGSGRFITPSRPESPVSGVRLGAQDILVNPQTGAILAQNAPAAGAAPGATPSAAPTAQADARSRYLAARGYELGPDGEVRYIRGGPQDPAVVQRLAEARRASGVGIGAPVAGKPMSESELARRRDAVAKEYRNAGTALQNLQETLNSAQQVRTATGLERATGFSGAYLPSFPGGAAAQAQTRLENLRGKITAMGKATAAMSGAIGSIANQEWKILADQIAVIDPVKGVGPMLEQIESLEKQALAAMGRIKDAYEKQYGEDFERFPQFRELPMPAQGAGLNAPITPPPARPTAPGRVPAQGGLTPAEQAELDALRRRFGRQQ